MTREDVAPHQRWMTLLAIGLLLWLAGLPLIEGGLRVAHQRAAAIAAERAELQQAADRFEDDMQLAEKADGGLRDEDIDRLLAPVDRLRVLAGLERQAAALRLSHFSYSLSPQKKAPMDVIAATDMATSDLTLTADMPLDGDATVFLQSVGAVLPGRLHLHRLMMTRIAHDAPLSAENLHMEANLQWLSNGAAQEGAVP